MKIDLKKERFDNIDSAFASIKESKSNRSSALRTIKANLKSTFNKSIDVTIIDSGKKDNFFIMSIYPDESTLDAVVDAIINGKEDDIIKKVWSESDKWTIEIDDRVITGSVVELTSKEITALLLHEIGHIVYSNSIPQRISKVMKLEYGRANMKLKELLKNKAFSQILRLPILHACEYDNYRTKAHIKKELKADVFVVKMGYGDELEQVLDKLISQTNTKQIEGIDKKSQDVYSDMRSLTNFSLKTLSDFKERKDSVSRENFKKLMFNNPSKYVQKCIGAIEDVFVKDVSETATVSESVKDEAYHNMADEIVEELYTREFFHFGGRNLKKLDPTDFNYILIEKENMKNNDDKMLLVSYINTKIDTINYYVACTEDKDNGFIVPHTKEQLLEMRSKLERIEDEVMKFQITRPEYGLRINYPEGYEG